MGSAFLAVSSPSYPTKNGMVNMMGKAYLACFIKQGPAMHTKRVISCIGYRCRFSFLLRISRNMIQVHSPGLWSMPKKESLSM